MLVAVMMVLNINIAAAEAKTGVGGEIETNLLSYTIETE